MKKIFSILFCFVAFNAFSQDWLDDSRFGLSFAPEISNKFMGRGQKPSFGFAYGINYTYNFKRNWLFKTRLALNHQGYKESLNKHNFAFLPEDVTFRQTYRDLYLEMPLLLDYYYLYDHQLIDNAKWKPYFSAGVNFDYLIHSVSLVDSSNNKGVSLHYKLKETIKNLTPSVRFQLGFVGSVGVAYNLSEYTSINLEAHYKYYVNPFLLFPAPSRLNKFGINIAIFYKFEYIDYIEVQR